jgi:hypothetical protein
VIACSIDNGYSKTLGLVPIRINADITVQQNLIMKFLNLKSSCMDDAAEKLFCAAVKSGCKLAKEGCICEE